MKSTLHPTDILIITLRNATSHARINRALRLFQADHVSSLDAPVPAGDYTAATADWSCWANAECDKIPLNEVSEHMAWLRANPFYAA